MDMSNLFNNTQHLKQLAEEFKQLKASPNAGEVDFNAWMRQRLREFRQSHQPKGAQHPPQHPQFTGEALSSGQKENVAPQASLQHGPQATQHQPAQAHATVAVPRAEGPPMQEQLSLRAQGVRRWQRPEPHPTMPPQQPMRVLGTGLVDTQIQAAAERDRRLAITSAVAREQVLLGIDSAALGSGGSAAPGPAQASEAVLEATRRLAEQQQSLMDLVTATQQQLNDQKVLLQQVASAQATPAIPTAAYPTPPRLAPDAVPRAWFIPPSTAPAPGDTSSAWPHGPAEPLHVLASCSPTGQLRKGRQQRKAELKAALKRVLFTDPLPPNTAAVEGSTDDARVRGVLRQLLGQQDAAAGQQHQPPRPGAQGPLLRSFRPHAFGQQDADDGHVHQQPQAVPGYALHQPWDIQATEEEAAEIVRQDRAWAEEQARHARLDRLEVELQAVQRAQQQAERINQHAAAGKQPQHTPATQQASTAQAPPAVQQQEQQAPGGSQAEQPQAGADNPQLVLHRMLAQLQRLEETEAAVRRRWLACASGPQPPPGAPVPAAFVAASGVLQAMQARPRSDSATQADTGVSHAPLKLPAAEATAAAAPRVESVNSDTVEAVQEGRRRYLEYQREADGLLMWSAGEAGVRPQDIVEDVADALLDELILSEARGMLDMCDAMAEQLYENEFV